MADLKDALIRQLLYSRQRADNQRTHTISEVCQFEFARWRLDRAAADDIFQEALLGFLLCGQFARILDDFAATNSLSSDADRLFLAIVRNKRVDHYKKTTNEIPASRATSRDSTVALEILQNHRHGDPQTRWLTEQITPEEDLLRQEQDKCDLRDRELAARFQELTGDEKLALIARYIDDLPNSQIASQMKTSEANVRKLQQRAREKLGIRANDIRFRRK